MKILFFGTPKFAEMIFNGLLENGFDVVGVVCQTDKPAGRGHKMISPHIVSVAREKGVNVYQFDKISTHIEDFKNIDFDYAVTASYGKILPKNFLDLFPCINVHPSLLPRYRGATPVQTALLNGDEKTGVTIMKTDVGVDDGDIYVQEEVEILPEENFITLGEKVAKIANRLLAETLHKIENGTQILVPQSDNGIVLCKMIKKEDAKLDFNKDASVLVNMVRAYVENPGAFFLLGDDRIKVFSAKVCELSSDKNAKIGEIIPMKNRFIIKAKNGFFEILECQCSGGKRMKASDFVNGYHFVTRVVTE